MRYLLKLVNEEKEKMIHWKNMNQANISFSHFQRQFETEACEINKK